MIEGIGVYAVPVILTIVGIIFLLKDGELFNEFLIGAKNGGKTCVEILPIMIILLTGVKMFSASGGIELIEKITGTLSEKIGVPGGIVPLSIVRMLSGSAANSVVIDLFQKYSPDSFIGRCASIIMGASDTIIYTLAMYFGAIGVKKSRYAIPASIITLLFCVIVSAGLTGIFYD